MKIVQIRSFFGPYFPVFSPNAEKYGPEKTLYLDTFHAVYKKFGMFVLNHSVLNFYLKKSCRTSLSEVFFKNNIYKFL